jgi:hypothetical protein
VLRPTVEISATRVRMTLPLLVTSMIWSSVCTASEPTTGPLRPLTLIVMMPLPPRFWTL